jgi:tetratricopeptide (TPR) repeat protein
MISMKKGFHHLPAASIALILACSSGAGKQAVATQVEKSYLPAVLKPSEITEENLDEAIRRFRDMDPKSGDYREMRAKLVQVLYEKHKKAAAAGEKDEAWAPLAASLKLFTAEEILAGDVTPEADSMAEWAVKVYSPLGDESKVMIALIVLMTRHPESEELKERYETLLGWITDARASLDDDAERLFEIIEIYTAVARVTPVPVVTTRLLELYARRHKVFSDMLGSAKFQGLNFGEVYMKYYFMNAMLERTSYDILWLHTRMGRPADAAGAIEKYKGKRGYDPKLVTILEKLVEEPGDANTWLILSEVFLDEDGDEAMACCQRGWKLDPTDYRFPMCIAKLYEKRKELGGAEEYLNVARTLHDKSPEIYVRLLTLYRDWLDRSIDEEKNEQAMDLLEKLEKTFKTFESRWSKMEAPLQWADIIKRRGKIEFFTGKIDAAVDHLQQAGDQSGDADSLLTLGTIYIFRKQYDRAMTSFEEALQIHRTSQMETRHIKMLALEKMGDAARIGGRKKDAAKYYGEALGLAQGLIPYISLDYVAELYAVEGELNHRLGNRQEALESFKVAVSLSKDEGAYRRILSYLMGTRDIDSMRELYHLAYTDSSISKKWKIYFSLWYMSLQKLTGVSDDPTPNQVLSMAKGEEWTDRLAAYYGGTISYEELKRSASDKGENVEMKFYRAFELAGQGKKAEFLKLLKETIDSEYYAYYEVSMALEILFDMGLLK